MSACRCRYGYRGELTINGTVHLRARDYTPVTGTFTKADPLDGIDGTTSVSARHVYTRNDPVNRVDPEGLSSVTDTTINTQPISSSGDDDCANDPLLRKLDPSMLESYGLSTGVSATDERDRELALCREDDANGNKDSRSNASGTSGFLGLATSSGEQLAACAWIGEIEGCAMAAQFIHGAFKIGNEVARMFIGDSAPRLAGVPGINAVRHFAWLALLTTELTRDSLITSWGQNRARKIADIHEQVLRNCNGTDQECAWDHDADGNNNQQGITFGETIRQNGLTDRVNQVISKAAEMLRSGGGGLDLRGGCPSRHNSVHGGC